MSIFLPTKKILPKLPGISKIFALQLDHVRFKIHMLCGSPIFIDLSLQQSPMHVVLKSVEKRADKKVKSSSIRFILKPGHTLDFLSQNDIWGYLGLIWHGWFEL